MKLPKIIKKTLCFLCVAIILIKISQRPAIPVEIQLNSTCECRRNDTVSVSLIGNTVYNVKTNSGSQNYQITESLSMMCDKYKLLRRGMAQKVISFSLYGTQRLYYEYLVKNIRAAKLLYPDWLIRIYHDSSIDDSIICQLECLKHNNQLLDNVDFCNVYNLPQSLIKEFNASYMLPMTWRWLPIGDDFVDLFVSRDTDSCIFDREVHAVKEWMASGTLFHIMRGKRQD